MRKFLYLFLLFALSANAEVVEIDGIFYDLKPVKVGTAQVTYDHKIPSNHEYTGDINIPSQIEYEGNTYIVDGIGDNAFGADYELISVTLPNTIQTIGSDSFWACRNLKSINIPSSVKTIERQAFKDCEGLQEVHISDINSWCQIEFNDYSNPLYYAHRLYIGDKEITDLVIPDDVTSITNRAFNGFSALKSVRLGSGLKSLGNYAFAWCSSLSSVIIPENVTEIGLCAFYECTNLTSLSLSPNISIISKEAFAYCSSLEEVRIPYGVTEIDTWAFRYCKNLKRIYIAESVQKIGDCAFGWCENISDVYCQAVTPPTYIYTWHWDTSQFFFNSYPDYATLHVPESSLDSYKNAFSWQNFGSFVVLSNEETAIKSVKSTDKREYYTLDGVKKDSPRNGLNIIKLQDGTVKKIVVK